jgi:hypothetical protein
MITIKHYLILAFFIFLLHNLYCQDSLKIKHGRINTISGEKIKINNLTFENNQFRYNDNKSSAANIMSLDNVIKIEKKQGNHALVFGLGLGAAGLIGGVLGTLNPYYDYGNRRMNFIISYTSVCAIAGVIWGSTQAKYKTVFVNPKYGSIDRKSYCQINTNSYTLNRYNALLQYK